MYCRLQFQGNKTAGASKLLWKGRVKSYHSQSPCQRSCSSLICLLVGFQPWYINDGIPAPCSTFIQLSELLSQGFGCLPSHFMAHWWLPMAKLRPDLCHGVHMSWVNHFWGQIPGPSHNFHWGPGNPGFKRLNVHLKRLNRTISRNSHQL